MILNDVIFCFDEGTIKIGKINKLQAKKSQGGKLEPEEEKEYANAEGSCKLFMLQANEFLFMLQLLSGWNSNLFVSEEFGNRVAIMLNGFLQRLCGEKALTLKVENSQSLNFDPKALLKGAISIYTNLSKHNVFIKCILNDERSFSISLFEKTEKILKKKLVVSLNDLEAFIKLCNDVKIESK